MRIGKKFSQKQALKERDNTVSGKFSNTVVNGKGINDKWHSSLESRRECTALSREGEKVVWYVPQKKGRLNGLKFLLKVEGVNGGKVNQRKVRIR